MLQPLLEDTSIVGSDDLETHTGKYGRLVCRVMKVVGADAMQFRSYDSALAVYLANGQDVIVKGPFLTEREFGDVEGLFEKFLEMMFVDCEAGNVMYSQMFLDYYLAQTKFLNMYELLSKTFSELELKLTLLGA